MGMDVDVDMDMGEVAAVARFMGIDMDMDEVVAGWSTSWMYVSQDVAPKARAKLFHLFAPSVRNSHCSCHEQSVNEFKTHVEEKNRG